MNQICQLRSISLMFLSLIIQINWTYHFTLSRIPTKEGRQQFAVPRQLITRAPIQCRMRHLIDIAKSRNQVLELSHCSEIWQASHQHCHRGTWQISLQYEHFNTRSRAFETLRYLITRILALLYRSLVVGVELQIMAVDGGVCLIPANGSEPGSERVGPLMIFSPLIR